MSKIKALSKNFICLFLILSFTVLLFTTCLSTGPVPQQTETRQSAVQAAPSSPPAPPQPSSSLFWTGDGGRGRSITILAPRATGLAADQAHLPDLVQGEFVSNFSSFSAISVLDRQRLDEQYSELFSGYYDDDTLELDDLGRLPPTDYLMGGSIIRTATGYSLQVSITRNSDKMTIASHSATSSFNELDNLTAIRQASFDLLDKMGIQPTDRTRTELAGAAETSHVSAQTTLAQGITALRQGTVVEALSYFIQSANFDPNLAEAASRLNILTASITSGNIGADVRNDIAWRNQWIERLEEAEAFYAKYIEEPPVYYLVYDPNIRQGAVNYQNETVALSYSMHFLHDVSWFDTINNIIQTLETGLSATGRTEAWGLDWPIRSISSQTPFREMERNINVVTELQNEDGVSLGRHTVSMPYGWILSRVQIDRDRYAGGGIIRPRPPFSVEVHFPAVNANLITDNLTIRIISIDGLTADQAAEQKRINILPSFSYNQLPVVRQNGWTLEAVLRGWQGDVNRLIVADWIIQVHSTVGGGVNRLHMGIIRDIDLPDFMDINNLIIPNVAILGRLPRSLQSITIGANTDLPSQLRLASGENGRRAGTLTSSMVRSQIVWAYTPQ